MLPKRTRNIYLVTYPDNNTQNGQGLDILIIMLTKFMLYFMYQCNLEQKFEISWKQKIAVFLWMIYQIMCPVIYLTIFRSIIDIQGIILKN